MSNFVIVDNDMLQFGVTFGMYTVTPIEPCMIKASGIAQIMNKKVCVSGDEKKCRLKLPMSAAYPTPGTGSITISSLAADQLANFAKSTMPLIVTGSQFSALLLRSRQPVIPKDRRPDHRRKPATGNSSILKPL
ncbi:hypothetical protein CWS02_00535 [Enterobacter sp. EA-1]|nr:hypothetical protein CWS02_00535 [Enterobacter sp. EA-1]